MRAALYFYDGCLNRGSEATLRGILCLLTKTFPGLEATLYSLRPEEDRAAALPEWLRIVPLFPPQMPTIAKISVDRLRLMLHRRTSEEKADEFFFGKLFAWSDILEHDLFICLGGDSYCNDSVSALAGLNRRLAETGKPVVLWGCLAGARGMTPQKREDLDRYSRIFAGENRSFTLLERLGLGGRACLCPDPAFLLEPAPRALPEGFVPGETVGLNLSQYALSASPEAMEAAQALLRQLLAEPGGTVALIPHMLRPGCDDREVLRPLLEGLPPERVFLLGEDGDWSAAQLKYAISQCRAFIGARSHAVIAAYATGIPALALGSSARATGIAEDLFGGFDGLVLPVHSLAPASLCAAVTAFMLRAPEMRTTLQTKLPGVMAEAESAATRLLPAQI